MHGLIFTRILLLQLRFFKKKNMIKSQKQCHQRASTFIAAILLTALLQKAEEFLPRVKQICSLKKHHFPPAKQRLVKEGDCILKHQEAASFIESVPLLALHLHMALFAQLNYRIH